MYGIYIRDGWGVGYLRAVQERGVVASTVGTVTPSDDYNLDFKYELRRDCQSRDDLEGLLGSKPLMHMLCA